LAASSWSSKLISGSAYANAALAGENALILALADSNLYYLLTALSIALAAFF